MPPKKRNQNKGQPTIASFITNDTLELDQISRDKKLQRETEKLLKLRRQMQQRKREQQRLMKVVLRLQISEGKKSIQEIDENDQQYWVMTSEESMGNKSDSLLKMILQDYGTVQMNNQRQAQAKQQDKQVITSSQAQWKQHGLLDPSYLCDYAADFIASLKEYQYLADQINPQ